jgi:hypothetical protein
MDFENLAHPTGFEFLPQIAAPISIRQLPLMSAANAAKAGYNSLILFSGAPEGIRPSLWIWFFAAAQYAAMQFRERLIAAKAVFACLRRHLAPIFRDGLVSSPHRAKRVQRQSKEPMGCREIQASISRVRITNRPWPPGLLQFRPST